MEEQKFRKLAIEQVKKYCQNVTGITVFETYVVWIVKDLQNNKALLSTNIPDGRYYEVTHDGDKHELYVDVYAKEKNFSVDIL